MFVPSDPLRLGLLLCLLWLLPNAAISKTYETLERRLRDHPAYLALTLEANAQAARSSVVGALPDPEVTLGVNNLPIEDPAFDRFLPTNKALGLQQRFPSRRLRRAETTRAQAQADTLSYQADALLAQLRGELLALLSQQSRVLEQRRLVDAERLKLQELAGVARTELEAGRPLLYRLAEVELAGVGAERKLIDLDTEQSLLTAELEALVGTAVQADPPDLADPSRPDDPRAFHAVRVAAAELVASEQGVAVAEAAWRPSWRAQLLYQQREAGDGFAGDDWVSASVTFSVPLWAARRQAPQLRAAQAQRGADQQRLQAVARAAVAAFDRERAIQRSAERTVAVLDRKLAAIEAEIVAQRSLFEAGSSDYTPILEGELALLRLRSEQAGERSRAYVALAQQAALVVAP